MLKVKSREQVRQNQVKNPSLNRRIKDKYTLMKTGDPGVIEFRGIACLSGFLFCNKLIYNELDLLKNSDCPGAFTSETPKKISETVRLARLSSVGIAFILCSFIGYGIGYYIDKWVDTKPVFTIIFVIFGIGAGFLNVYRAVTKDTD